MNENGSMDSANGARRRRAVRWAIIGSALIALAAAGIVPALASSTSHWLAVSAGNDFTCGIKTDGSLWCWGYNGSGQLGLGDNTDRSAPTLVSSGQWASISAGSDHACAIDLNALRYCWGLNADGELGLGDRSSSHKTPTMADDGIAWASVSAGGRHSCGVATDGTGYCWGADFGTGDLGIDNPPSMQLTPAVVHGRHIWTTISAGYYQSCGLDTANHRRCWGRNADGALGLNDLTDRSVPTSLKSDRSYQFVDVDSAHACAVGTDTHLYCWGQNTSGQVGVGDTDDHLSPAQVSTHAWEWVGEGAHFSCGLYTDGTRFCWGENTFGQLGLGDTGDRTAPRHVRNESAWNSLAVGFYHACGIQNEFLSCWGDNSFGQLGVSGMTMAATPQLVK